MAKKEVSVELKPLEIKEITITIEGDTPLIVNNFNEKTKQQMLDTQMKKAKSEAREPKNPVENFMRSLNWLTDMPNEFTLEAFDEALKNGAKFGFPATGVKKSAVSGAFRNKMAKDKVSLYGAFHIPLEYIEIKYKKINMREDMVRVGMGTPDIRHRAEFEGWSMTFPIKYVENTYSLEQIINFFNIGGFGVGIGESRIEKGGTNGSYHVKANN